jgi:hypothetical protein
VNLSERIAEIDLVRRIWKASGGTRRKALKKRRDESDVRLRGGLLYRCCVYRLGVHNGGCW